MTNNELSVYVRDILKSANIEDYEFDSRCILEDEAGFNYFTLTIHGEEQADPRAEKRSVELAKKRADGVPLQYLLGTWGFYGLDFKVGEGVLIPRPDTEILVETVLEHFKDNPSPEIADLCSGTGCVAIALKKKIPQARVSAVELSSEAMPYLVENIRRNKVAVSIIKGDVTNGHLLENYPDLNNEGELRLIDCIVSNPPYLTDKEMSELQTEVGFEPEMALAGGSDGLKFYRIISCLWREILKPDGLIAFEVGTEQACYVADILRKNGYRDVKIIKDYNDLDRVVTGINVVKEQKNED